MKEAANLIRRNAGALALWEAAEGVTKENAKALRHAASEVIALSDPALPEHQRWMAPAGWRPVNALQAWMLALREAQDKNRNPAMAVVSPESVYRATLTVATLGLDPAAQQCHPIVFGDQLVCMMSYLGGLSLVKRIYGRQATVNGVVVYEADEVEIAVEDGVTRIIRHETALSHHDGDIVGAYAVPALGPGYEPVGARVMTMKEIRGAWEVERAVHRDNPARMSEKTVISSTCRRLFRSAPQGVLAPVREWQRVIESEAVAAEQGRIVERAEVGDDEPEPGSLDATPDLDEAPAAAPAESARPALPAPDERATIDAATRRRAPLAQPRKPRPFGGGGGGGGGRQKGIFR